MVCLARLTDLTDGTDKTDKCAKTGAEAKYQAKIPVISRHDLFPAASDSSDLSDKVRGKPDDPLAKNPDFGYIIF